MLLKNTVKIIARAKKLLNFYMIRRRGKEVKKKIPKEKYKRYFFSYAHAPDGTIFTVAVGGVYVSFFRALRNISGFFFCLFFFFTNTELTQVF